MSRGRKPNLTATGKVCLGCGQDKPLTDFGRSSRSRHGLESRCRGCVAEYRRRWHERNPGKGAEYNRRYDERNPDYRRREYEQRGWEQSLVKRYGITAVQFHELLEAQGGVCAICGRPGSGEGDRQMHVDHCHQTGKVRGILCGPCNKGIGSMGDDPDRLLAAAAYLLKNTNVLEVAP